VGPLRRCFRILLVEDNEGDIDLARETLDATNIALELSVVRNGDAAMKYLRREEEHAEAVRPDLIILDLNLPRKPGREVLAEIKQDIDLKRIPVVVLTSSAAERDVVESYDLGANCYVTKPVDLKSLQDMFRNTSEYWFTVVRLPT
jgi:two-component system, chemotaxis family, response regulator Rcp1